MTPLLPLLALVPALAADNFTPLWTDYKRDLGQVYRDILAASVYPEKGNMGNDPRWIEPNGPFAGAGALAFAPRIGLNKNPFPLVVATSELPELAHSVDEAAFVFAHEFAHLEKGHPQKLNGMITGLFDAWSKDKPDEYWNTPSDKVQEDFRKGAPKLSAGDAKAKGLPSCAELGAYTNAECLAKFQSGLEDEADLRGKELMGAAQRTSAVRSEAPQKYDPQGAARLLQHADEWLHARLTGQQLAELCKQAQDHRPPKERARSMAEDDAKACVADLP